MTENVNLTAVFTAIPVFADGFESGSFSSWNGTLVTSGENATVLNTLVHHGSRSAYFASNGDSSSEAAYCYANISPQDELYVRGYFYINQSGITNNDNRFYLIVLRANSKVAFAGWRQTGGVVKWTLTVRNGTGYVNLYSVSSPELGRWYSVELRWKKDSVNGLGELWVDGSLVCSTSGRVDTSYYGSVNRVDFGLAELNSCKQTTIYCDCCSISKQYNGPEPS
jgi:hypothetical protein